MAGSRGDHGAGTGKAAALWRTWLRWTRPGRPGRRGTERRQLPRYPCTAAVICRPVTGPATPPTAAQARDLSLAGLGLLFHHPVQPGTLWEVALRNPATGYERTRLLLIQHTRETGAASRAAGGPFYRELAPAELRALC